MPAFPGSHSIALYRSITRRLPACYRRGLWLYLAGAVIYSVLEVLSVGSIATFATAISDPLTIQQSRYALMLEKYLSVSVPKDQLHLLLATSVAMVLLLMIKNGFSIVLNRYFTKLTTDIEAQYGKRMLEGILRLPFERIAGFNSADLQYIVNARVQLGRGFVNASLSLLADTIIVVMMLAALLLAQPLTSLGVMGFSLLVGLLVFKFIRPRLDRTSQGSLDTRIAIHLRAAKAVHGNKDIRLLNKEKPLVSSFTDLSFSLSRIVAQQRVLSLIPAGVLETFGFLALAGAVCLIVSLSGQSGGSVLAAVTLMAVAAWRILPAVSRILSSGTLLRSAIPEVEYCLAFSDEVDAHLATLPPMTEAAPNKSVFTRDVELRNVSFAYKDADRKALDDVSLRVEKRQTIGVVGRSGGGKSTLIDVLVGLFPPTGGAVLIDGAPLDDALRPAWINNLGYVPQSSYIFDGTLAENVAYASPPEVIDRERVLRCCGMAGIDFLDELPQGMDTLIGERGSKLSGGQVQRVAIARALYPDPELLIFDEATSSLDTKTEDGIRRTIYGLKGKLTMIIVAHRLSTVRDCDHIVWLEKGRVVRSGPPEEVLAEYEKKHS